MDWGEFECIQTSPNWIDVCSVDLKLSIGCIQLLVAILFFQRLELVLLSCHCWWSLISLYNFQAHDSYTLQYAVCSIKCASYFLLLMWTYFCLLGYKVERPGIDTIGTCWFFPVLCILLSTHCNLLPWVALCVLNDSVSLPIVSVVCYMFN